MVQVQFIGCGDAFGSGGRFQTCILVRGAATSFLIDCGASSLIAMRQQCVEPNEVDTIVLTHLHGDHFAGIPFLLLDAALVSRRQAPLRIAGPPASKRRIFDTMELLFPGSSRSRWRFDLDVVELEPERETELGMLRVTPYPVTHPSGSLATALRIECDGRVVSYSGDTEWNENLRELARDADLLIAETYTVDKVVPYHMSYGAWAARRQELGAKRIVATHMGAEALSRLDEIGFETAADGMLIEL